MILTTTKNFFDELGKNCGQTVYNWIGSPVEKRLRDNGLAEVSARLALMLTLTLTGAINGVIIGALLGAVIEQSIIGLLVGLYIGTRSKYIDITAAVTKYSVEMGGHIVRVKMVSHAILTDTLSNSCITNTS